MKVVTQTNVELEDQEIQLLIKARETLRKCQITFYEHRTELPVDPTDIMNELTKTMNGIRDFLIYMDIDIDLD